jgi:hypothetical protein
MRPRTAAKDWKGGSIESQAVEVHGHAMATPNSSRITVEIETGADPIRGSIEHPGGRSEPFWGWLELLEELRRVAGDAPERAPPGQPGRASGPTRQAKRQRPRTVTQETP